ncbi:menaquinone-specific isochorismate synthase [Sulfuricella denitrificans skB26]|uniref:isochorismate synthase n=1 Tax=Sulfuricella denitrificans (strain DSM 22764 / NBRC 105220 / skB26) TaxID=1163617 RepID=S6A9J3_SULDS|nr:isochorismate synthase [Sulfuricella denitrificans]BAN34210.1 menaquinone-specific isochorismate synthase [Sulfuricella denitrificans skB26]
MTQPAHRTPSLLQALEMRLGNLLRQHGGGSGLLSLTLGMPELDFDRLPEGLRDCSYWARPAAGRFLLGLGVAASVEAQGEGRFRALDAAFAEYRRLWLAVDEDGLGFQPVALAGFAFGQEGAGDIPNSRLTIPTLLVQRREEICAMTFTCDRGSSLDTVLAGWMGLAGEVVAALHRETSPPANVLLQRISSQPDDDIWLEQVVRAVKDICAGELDKVVLARSIRVRSTQPFVPAALMATLAMRYPGCVHFTHFFPSGGVLLGATPESLVSLANGQVVSDALAGTDWQSGRLDDEKSLHEHRLVVNAIVRALEPVCGFLQIPARPKVFELQELRHLRSVIKGTVDPGVSLLNLVERLHPTPAIGGAPVRRALDWLARHGEMRSGWYSGATGWIGYDGDGEFAVALRCAWLDGNEAELYAGAGIVAGSDPRNELEETEAKLNAMLRVLGGQA